MNRGVLKSRTKDQLRGKWTTTVLIVLIYLVISGGVSIFPILGAVANIIISPVLLYGLNYHYIRVARREFADVGDLFVGFKNFGNALVAGLLIGIFSFLWSLLFIIPGIIATLSYSFTYYIMIDNPQMGALEAIRKSKEMTNGYKWDLFVLGLSFIGWALLMPFTCGIGVLWLAPYQGVTFINFYEDVKANRSNKYA